MPGGKRSERISPRDIEVLEFIARFGLIPRSAVAIWADTSRTVTIVRERRLRESGLITVHRAFADSGPLVCATRAGMRACGRPELRPSRPAPATIGHDAFVAQLAATMERRGERLLSERETLARERAEGSRIFSAMLGERRFHRADLLRLDPDGEQHEAIEVELTTKGAARLDALLRAWRRTVAERRLSRVTYLCAPHTMPYVEAAVRRTQTHSVIAVEEL